jgi:hypothetical protein
VAALVAGWAEGPMAAEVAVAPRRLEAQELGAEPSKPEAIKAALPVAP